MSTRTNKDLETELTHLSRRMDVLQQSSSRLRDDVVELKSHYTRLVDGLNDRFQTVIESMNDEFKAVRDRFKAKKR